MADRKIQLQPMDSAIPQKIRRVASQPVTDTSSQRSDRSIIQPQTEPVDTNELAAMIEKWKQNEPSQRLVNKEVGENIELKELNAKLAEGKLKLQRLKCRLEESQVERLELSTSLEAAVKAGDEIVLKANCLSEVQSAVREQVEALAAAMEHTQQEKERLSKIYDTVILKENQETEDFKQQLANSNQRIFKKREEYAKILSLKTNRIADLGKTCLDYEKKISEICHTTSETQKLNEGQNVRIFRLNEDLKDQIKQVSELATEKEDMRKIDENLQVTITSVRHENIKLQNLIKEENVELTEGKRACEEKLKVVERQLEIQQCTHLASSERVSCLAKELAEVKYTHEETISKQDLELADHRNQLQDMKDLRDSVLNDIQEYSAKLNGKEKSVVHLEGKLKQLECEMKEKDDPISENMRNESKYDEELYNLKEKLNEQEKYQNENEAEIAVMEEKLEESEDKYNEFLRSLQETQIERDTLSKEADSLRQQNESKKSRIAEFKGNIEKLLQENDVGGSRNNAKIQDMKQLIQECTSDSDKHLKEQQSKCEKLNAELSALRLKNEKYSVNAEKTEALHSLEISKMEAQLKHQISKYEEMNEKFHTAKEKNDELQGKSKRKKEVFAAVSTREGPLRTKFAKCLENLRKMKDKYKEASDEMNELETKLKIDKDNFEYQLTEQIKNYEQLKDDRDKKNAEISKLQAAEMDRINKVTLITSAPKSILKSPEKLSVQLKRPRKVMFDLESGSSDLSGIYDMEIPMPGRVYEELVIPRRNEDVTQQKPSKNINKRE